ncbi:permease [bacterium]|nr:permease [bacterium]
MHNFFGILGHYAIEIVPSLALGFFLSGIIHEFIPGDIVEKHLGGRGILPLIYSTVAGTLLPICCVGSLPVAVSLREKGASVGAVVAFLIATPATSLSAIFVCYSLLGLKFTLFLFFAVIFMGITMGALADIFGFKIRVNAKPTCICHSKDKNCTLIDPVCGMEALKQSDFKIEHDGATFYFCSAHCKAKFEESPDRFANKINEEKCEHCAVEKSGLSNRLVSALKFAFFEMPKDIGLELVLGLLLAVLIASFNPIGQFVSNYLSGIFAYPVSLIFGMMMYICSTASVPLVDALVSQGMNIGAGMVLLLAGPITSWGTILVIRSQFGGKMLAFYLGGIAIFSLIIGYAFTLI